MTVYIVRHAHKEEGDFFNPGLRHQDQPTSREGRAQAQALCAYFEDKEISKIYISAYQRTQQTIAPVAARFNLVPVLDERLNEIDNGLFDGGTEAELQLNFPEEWRAFCERKTDFRFPEGESGEGARDRIAAFLEEVREAHGESNTIAVTHEGWIRLLMCHIMGNPVYHRWNFYVDYCGITELVYQPDHGAWKLMRFNQVCA